MNHMTRFDDFVLTPGPIETKPFGNLANPSGDGFVADGLLFWESTYRPRLVRLLSQSVLYVIFTLISAKV